MDNLEKNLTARTDARSQREISLNNDVLHYEMDTNRPTSKDRAINNGTKVVLKRKEAEKVIKYLSEHVEIEGNIIKPKPINATLIKFDSLKPNTKLFSGTVCVKTRMNVHILPLLCPYKHRHRSSAMWLEESYHHLFNVVNYINSTVSVLQKKLATSLNETIGSFEKFQDLAKKQQNQTNHNIAQIAKLMNSSIDSLKIQLLEKISESETAQ